MDTHLLVQQIEQLTQELADARSQAKQTSSGQSNLLAVASHDLRQPLHALSLYMEVLESKLLDDEQLKLMSKARQSYRALSMLLHSLLDIARLESGVVCMERNIILLAPLMNQLHEEWLLQAQECGLELRMRSCGDVAIYSDAMLLKRILRNFLANAVRHSRQGGILFGCRRIGNHLRIAVWDTGDGISENELSHIFDAFYQGIGSQDEPEKGLGLGLSIVKQLAGMLGYHIHVRSRSGRGSCFAVDVPVAELTREASVVLESLTPSDMDLQGTIVIVIDDDRMVLDMMYELLVYWGCRVFTGSNADDIITELQVYHLPIPTLIVADYDLGEGRTGIREAKQICKIYNASIPVLMMTAVTEENVLREIKAASYVLLKKPVNAAQLRASLHYCINQG